MIEMLIVVVSLASAMAALGAGIWGLYSLGGWLNRAPTHLRGHFFAAAVWSVITLCQTASLLSDQDPPNVVGHAALFVAGWVMVSSWGQFAERRAGSSHVQDRRRLPHRLFVQTFWGPLALWLGAAAVCHVGTRLFDNALARRDVPNVFLLRHYGIGDVSDAKYGSRMSEVIKRGDLDGVKAYLAAGVDPDGWYYGVDPFLETAVGQKNVVITRLLLQHGASPEGETYRVHEYPLHTAVKNGDVRQVQALLQGGAERRIYNQEGKTPFQLAKESNQPDMIATLLSVDSADAARRGK